MIRTFLALLITIFTALWIYGSIRVYNCSVSETCDFLSRNTTFEIVIMLLGTFIFGYLFGNILSGMKTKKYIKKSELDTLQGSYTQSKKYGLYKEDLSRQSSKKHNLDTPLNHIDNNFFSYTKENNEVDSVLLDGKKANETGHKKSLFTNFLDDIKFEEDTESDIQETSKVDTPDFIKDKVDSEIINYSAIKKEAPKSKDSLTTIEGIGPKIEILLNSKNIYTFSDLAQSDAFDLSSILTHAGTRFQMHNPKTWPKQAALARDKKWEDLKKYQDILKGGKE